MGNLKAKLSIVIKDGTKYASVFFASLTKSNDLYYGGNFNIAPELFRMSHHRDGRSWIRTPRTDSKPKARKVQDSIPLDELNDELFLGGSAAPPLGSLSWDYKPRPDSKTRESLIFEIDKLPASWSIEVWALGENYEDQEKLEGFLKLKTKGITLLGYILVDWTMPRLLIIAWTLTEDSWKALDDSVRLP